MKYHILSYLVIILTLLQHGLCQQTGIGSSTGNLQQNVYQFIKANQMTTKFGQILDQIAQQTNDRSVIQALSGESSPSMSGVSSQNGYTVFVPVNDALNQLPNDLDSLKNDMYNLIVRDRFTLERIRQLNGSSLTSTFGFRPHLILRSTKNFYLNQLMQSTSQDTRYNKIYQQQSTPLYNQQFSTRMNKRKRRQAYTTRSPYQNYPQSSYYPGSNTQYPGQTFSPNQYSTMYPGQQIGQFSTLFPGQTTTFRQDQFYPNNNNNQSFYPNQPYQQQQQQSQSSVYEMYSQMYGSSNKYDGPPISAKLPRDELFLLNNAIILDRFDLLNGIVYLINANPRYYEKSILGLLTDGDVNGLASNLNFWITKAAQSFRLGDENLKNALNAYGPNTYFLPTDTGINKFTNREQLNNASFLFDILFKSHRVSNQLLFDYYLDDPAQNYYTDGGLPVSTAHRRVNGIDEIEVSIGHVKGRILNEYRNIYCASGVVHLIDTVLGVPSRSAYQEIAQISELSTFRSILDRSTNYRTLLDQVPAQTMFTTRPYYQPRQLRQGNSSTIVSREKRQFMQSTTTNMYATGYTTQPYGGGSGGSYGFNSNVKFVTVLAPNDFALIGIKDDILNNQSAIESFLSAHIIPDRVIYTDHDDVIFQNGQTYSTMNPTFALSAVVQQDPTGVSNIVSLQAQANPSIRTTIVNGNDRVSNGVVHIVDKPLVLAGNVDITAILSANNAGSPAFSQFVDALRSTGIFNDLRQPSKKYTLFIPTNEALASYQDIMNSNDIERKRKLIYRHICLDQNLQSTYLLNQQQQITYTTTQSPEQFSSNQLICRNALGQDLTLTKDSYGLVSNWQGLASAKVINDFPGIYSSAYVLEKPLLNQNLPNYGLNNVNSAVITTANSFNLIMIVSFFYYFLF